MKRYLLLPIFILSVMSIAFAQAALTFSPDMVEKEGVADPNDLFVNIIAKTVLVNEGNAPITIRWERIIIDSPSEWGFQVCDLNQCYGEIAYSNVAPDLGLEAPVTLAPGDTTNIDVYAIPKGVAGSASVRVEIADVNNQDEILTSALFNFTAETAVSNTEQISSNDIKLYPNPTVDYFQINGADQADRVVIYNIIGKQMRTFNVAPGKLYDLADLPNGMYLASLVSNKEGILKTFRIGKRAVRP